MIAMGMTSKEQLIAVAEAWCLASGKTLEHASYKVFQDARRLPSIIAGETDPRVGSCHRAIAQFSRIWPDDHDWPSGIERPVEEAAS